MDYKEYDSQTLHKRKLYRSYVLQKVTGCRTSATIHTLLPPQKRPDVLPKTLRRFDQSASAFFNEV